MASPKSGKAGSPVAPADPIEAAEADVADPGEAAEAKAAQQGKYGTTPTEPYKKDPEKAGWIEIELVDEDDKPVPGESYAVTLPDGAMVAQGTLDDKGFARIDGIDSGMCRITFPGLDREMWSRA